MKEPAAPNRIQVIDRAAALLDAIARYPDPVSLKVLGAETGLHPSTAHRILASLIDNRLVEKDAGGRYRLGLRLLQLGVRLHSKIDLRSVALPVIATTVPAPPPSITGIWVLKKTGAAMGKTRRSTATERPGVRSTPMAPMGPDVSVLKNT